jgi:hypothetical protein
MDAGVPSRQAPLTVRQAARRAGQDETSSKTLADMLNGTPADLRLCGNRGAARYDAERLRHWLRGREMPDESPLKVRTTAAWDGGQRTVRDAERSVSVAGPRLMAAQRSLVERLAQALQVAGDRILLDITYEAGRPALPAWAEAESLEVRWTSF